MDAAFENLLKETEQRRRNAMAEFFDKYENNDGYSDEEVFDFKALQIVQPRGKKKKKLNKVSKKLKRVLPKAARFGEMNSYSISVESRKYIRTIIKHIKTMKQSDGDSILCYEQKEYEETETTEIIISKNRIYDSYDHEESDFFEDDKSLCDENQNETLPLSNKSNLNCALISQLLLNSKLDSLVYDNPKVNRKGKYSFPKIHTICAYNQYFRSIPTLDPLRKGLSICPLTNEPQVKNETHSGMKCVDSDLKFSNKFSTLKSVSKESFNVKKCSVLLQSLPLPKIAASNFKYSRKSSNNSKLVVKNNLSRSRDEGVQKLIKNESNCKKRLLESSIYSDHSVSMRKNLRPRCPKSGLAAFKSCACSRCARRKRYSVICTEKIKLQNMCNTTVLRNSNTYKTKNVFGIEKSNTKSVSHGAVNLKARISKNHSTDKSFDLNSKPSTVKNDYAVQMVKNAVSNSEYKLQNVCNLPGVGTNNTVPDKDICRPQRKKQLILRKVFASNRYPAKKLDRPNKISDTHLMEKSFSDDDSDLSGIDYPLISSRAITGHSDEWHKMDSEGTFLRKKKVSQLEKSDAEYFNHNYINCIPKVSGNISLEKSNEKISSKNNNSKFGSSPSSLLDQFSSSNDITLKIITPPHIYKEVASSNKDKLQTISHSVETEVSNVYSSNKICISRNIKESSPRKALPSSLSKFQETSISMLSNNILQKENVSLFEKVDVKRYNHGCIDSTPRTSKNLPMEKPSNKNIKSPNSCLFSGSNSIAVKGYSGNDTSTCLSKNEACCNSNKLQTIFHSEVCNTVPNNNICFLQPDKFSSSFSDLSISCGNAQYSTDKQLLPNNTSASSQVLNRKNKQETSSNSALEKVFSKKNISLTEKSVAENLQYKSVKLCNEISGKLVTVKSNGESYPKISSPVATNPLMSENYFSNPRHVTAKGCSVVGYPVFRNESRIKYRKDEFKISRNKELGINENVPSKDTSTPYIEKKHLRSKKASVPNTCPASGISDNSSNKDISTPKIVKNHLITKTKSIPYTYSTQNIDSHLSRSVKKSNLKYARRTFCNFNKSSSAYCSLFLKPLSTKLKNKHNSSVDSLSML